MIGQKNFRAKELIFFKNTFRGVPLRVPPWDRHHWKEEWTNYKEASKPGKLWILPSARSAASQTSFWMCRKSRLIYSSVHISERRDKEQQDDKTTRRRISLRENCGFSCVFRAPPSVKSVSPCTWRSRASVEPHAWARDPPSGLESPLFGAADSSFFCRRTKLALSSTSASAVSCRFV